MQNVSRETFNKKRTAINAVQATDKPHHKKAVRQIVQIC